MKRRLKKLRLRMLLPVVAMTLFVVILLTGRFSRSYTGMILEQEQKLNAAGFENFGKVFEGQERSASFEGKAGYKYRIVYQALDYHGMIASNRYYVQF